ncbi:DUF3800 domain-containing protein [Parasphingorhabdus sp. NYA22]
MAIIARAGREPPNPEELSDIYIDESSQTKHRFLLLAGMIVQTNKVPEVLAEINRLRLPELPHGEMKWNKVSNSKLLCYKRIVDGFFDRPQFSGVHFHSIIVDTHHLNHRAFNDGSREVGFNKEIYQLASKFARLYKNRLFHLYLDQRETSQRPEDLRTILNFGRSKVGDSREWPFRRSHFRDSKTTPALQMVDIFAGAIAYHVNGHIDLENASPAKVRLARYILRRAGIVDPTKDTSMSGKFTIWHRQLRK